MKKGGNFIAIRLFFAYDRTPSHWSSDTRTHIRMRLFQTLLNSFLTAKLFTKKIRANFSAKCCHFFEKTDLLKAVCK